MKVYLVTRGIGWDFELLGIFSDRQRADQFASEYMDLPNEKNIYYWNGRVDVREYDLDSPVPKENVLTMHPL